MLSERSSASRYGSAQVAWIAAFALGLLATGCGAPTADPATSLGKQAILDSVDLALNTMSCNDAIAAITPLYNSAASDNSVRMRAASAYACDAGLNFFGFVATITATPGAFTTHPDPTNPADTTKEGLWPFLAQNFYSQAGADYRAEGAILASDALLAALTPSALVLPANQTSAAGSYNPGSIFPSDRSIDANFYLAFSSMAAIGSLGSRYGAPDTTTWSKSTDLPWKTATAVTADGCAYASALVNLFDSLAVIVQAGAGSVSGQLGSVNGYFSTVIDQACSLGCNGTVPPAIYPLNKHGNWVGSGCSSATTGCSKCPAALRDRSRCKSITTDQVSCAAAGIVNFINASAYGWQ